jgi:hypothetical protein
VVAPARKKARRDTGSSQESSGLVRVKSETEAEPNVSFIPFRHQAWATGLGKDLQVENSVVLASLLFLHIPFKTNLGPPVENISVLKSLSIINI